MHVARTTVCLSLVVVLVVPVVLVGHLIMVRVEPVAELAELVVVLVVLAAVPVAQAAVPVVLVAVLVVLVAAVVTQGLPNVRPSTNA